MRDDRLVFGGLEESLPRVVLAEASNFWAAREITSAHGKAERLAKELCLSIDGRRFGALLGAHVHIAVDGLGGQVTDSPGPESLEDGASGLAFLGRYS